ncbi:MAG: hypothetical protein RLZZ65_568 [Bacteroidota bacterium]|jgi:carbon monoxide dehydrogenase subunit G
MVRIQSPVLNVHASQDKVQRFLSTFANYELLLPKEQVSDFQCLENGFSFKAAGNFLLALSLESHTDHSFHFKGSPQNPFPFELTIQLQEAQGITNGSIEIKADVNMMMKMLLEKPLQKLLQQMTNNLEQQLQLLDVKE